MKANVNLLEAISHLLLQKLSYVHEQQRTILCDPIIRILLVQRRNIYPKNFFLTEVIKLHHFKCNSPSISKVEQSVVLLGDLTFDFYVIGRFYKTNTLFLPLRISYFKTVLMT